MNNLRQWQKAVFSAFVLCSIIFSSFSFSAQGVGTSEDIVGSNVFVFRKPKPAQTKAPFRSNFRSQPLARNNSSRAARQQAGSLASSQRVRTNKIDPNLVAQNTRPVKPVKGKPTPPPNTMTKEKTSVMLAGAGETLLDKNQVDDAIGFFEQAVELNPKNVNARLGLSEAYARKGDASTDKENSAEAIKFYTQAIKYNDKNTAALVGLGAANDAEKAPDQAISYYQQALAVDGKLSAVYEPLGMLYYQKGDWVNADKYLSQAIAGGASNADVQYYLGVVRYKQNRNDEAIASLKQSLQTNPNSAEAHYYLGEAYDRADKDQEAIAEYKRAVQIEPNFLEAWFDLGVANYNHERYEDSVDAYKNAIRIKNDFGDAHANLADTYRLLAMNSKVADKRKEFFGLANGEYQIASVFIKDDAELYSNWGFCLGRVEKWETAVQRLNTAIQINPVASDYSNLGWANLNWGEYDQMFKKDEASAKVKFQNAKVNLEKAVQINPKLSAAYVNLGITSSHLGEFQAAVNALQTALSMRSEWWVLDHELGYAYRGLNDFTNAIKYFTKTTELNKNFADGWYNLGEAQYRAGNIKEAKKAMEQVRKLDRNLGNRLDAIIKGAVVTDPRNQIQNKVNEKNPINKIPKLPF